MRKIISSIDIGSDSIKLIVGEFINNRLFILSATKIENNGLLNGKITDFEGVSKSIKEAAENVSKILGITIKKVVVGISSSGAKLIKSASAIKIKNENQIIDGDNISTLMTKVAEGKIPDGYVLIGTIPVEFTLDNDVVSKDPKGESSENLGLKAIIVTAPKEKVGDILKVLAMAELKVIDVIPNALGDYYMYKSNKTDEKIGTVINIGYEETTISIFNKGLLTNTKSFPMGVKAIVHDISFVNKLEEKESYAIFKDIILASNRLASTKEYRIVTNLDGEEIKLNQFDLSEIAASRIEEILNLTKKQINILTKKEISYIIITGGLTEVRDFSLALDSNYGKMATIGTVNLIGARDNSYATAIGLIKYFNYKLNLKDKTFSIFNDDEIDEMNNGGKRVSVNNESLLNKVFGYFFDN